MGRLASAAECMAIKAQAAQVAADLSVGQKPTSTGDDGYRRSSCIRMPIREKWDAAGVQRCEALLVRALTLLHALPSGGSLLTALFGGIPDGIVGNRNLALSEGEPAVNLYAEGGEFKAHEDKHSLTVLVTLTDSIDFVGGGTAVWSVQDRGPNSSLRDVNPPTFVLRPPAGSVLIFCGTVTHGALPVTSGERCVLVASFSPKSRYSSLPRTFALCGPVAAVDWCDAADFLYASTSESESEEETE